MMIMQGIPAAGMAVLRFAYATRVTGFPRRRLFMAIVLRAMFLRGIFMTLCFWGIR
jgi:hypothetical protein